MGKIMKKHVLPALLIPALAVAAPGDEYPDLYFSADSPKLTPQEQAAISIGKRWQASTATGLKPATGPDGSIQFLYGATQPSIVCAVLQVCDVELQPGEQVNSVNLGDTARWTVEPAITGYGEGEVQHLIIKPKDVGLDTSLIVTTNRRTYHFRLRSHRTEYMPRVSFTYPDEAQKKWDAVITRERQARREQVIPETGESLGNLDFNYTIEGNGPWKPVRVYNDGTKTIIQMPSTLAQTEAPTLLILRGKDSLMPWGSKAEEVLVNYRVQGNRYIVDSIFDQAILIAGVGSSQEKVTVTREGTN
jgi:P-type conjugative transfer protein TrbG